MTTPYLSDMPLHWTVQSHIKLIIVVAEGDVGRSDIDGYLAMSSGADIIGWRKLFDARASRSQLTRQDVNELGVRIRAVDAARAVGPIAFVMPKVESPELARLLGFLAVAKRPMRIFNELAPAQKWILTVETPAGRPPTTPT
ncbi:MAG: hypothetical protein JWQ58_3472 [Reyranella sp.]|nr:hypothetical protein [Reyranella sp.]